MTTALAIIGALWAGSTLILVSGFGGWFLWERWQARKLRKRIAVVTPRAYWITTTAFDPTDTPRSRRERLS